MSRAASSSGGPSPAGGRDAWYIAAESILSKMKKNKGHLMPKTGRELCDFLKRIGFIFHERGKGDHDKYKFSDKEKFRKFLQEMDQEHIGDDFFPGDTVSVDTGGEKRHTVEASLHTAFGLSSQGQKPGKK